MVKIFTVLIVTALLGCTQGTETTTKTLESTLIRTLQSGSIVDAYKACIFLGELALNEKQTEIIQTSLPKSPCKFYLLAKRVGNTKNISDFIDNFPNSTEQKEIWRIHRNAGYPIHFTPPYISYLTTIAITSDAALDKLIDTLNHTDGAHADAMIEVLAKLYIKHSERVSILFKRNKTPENLINLIVETSIYFQRNEK